MATTKTNPNQGKEDTLEDADGDTKVQVEETSDDDKIRFDTSGTERMIIDSTGVGIATSSPAYNLHVASSASSVLLIDGASNTDAILRFGQAGTLKSYIKQGSGGNLVITNETADKDIILSCKDSSTEREGLRINGDVAEVVINEGSESLVDFRVESDDNTHMLFVDGSENKVGINNDSPSTALHVVGKLKVDSNASGEYVAVFDNDQGSAGHGMKITSDGTGTGTYLLDIEAASTTLFRFRADGRLGIGTTTPGQVLTVEGDIGIGTELVHKGDSDTKIVFADDKITLKAGNKAMITMEEKGSSPHEITLNDGGNNIDFAVKGNGSNEGNPLFMCDASTGRVGINGVGSPAYELDVDGTIRATGDLYVDKIRRATDSGTTTKILLNDEAIKIYAGHSSDNICTVDSSGLQVLKSVAFPTGGSPKTGAYTITEDDFCTVADCNSSAFTITLPTATDAMAGRIYTIKRMDSGNSGGANQLTISRNSKNIDNIAGDLALANLDAVTLQCIGASGGWIRIGQFLAPMP